MKKKKKLHDCFAVTRFMVFELMGNSHVIVVTFTATAYLCNEESFGSWA